MSDHQLPEDLSLWPDTPHELLGVQRTTSAREVKRAYTRLIRTYKPELFPEHFRRIREAYERVLRFLEWSTEDSSSSEESPAAETVRFPQQPVADIPRSREPAEPYQPTRREPPPPSLEEQLRTLWLQACDGRQVEAYRQLVELSHLHPGDPQICLRGYWLLTLDPELDSTRVACDWLVAGLKSNRLTGPLRELYRREVEGRYDEALSPRCELLLKSDADPWSISELMEARWRAAARIDDPAATIAFDFELLRARLLPNHEEYWLQVILMAASFALRTTSVEGQQVVSRCRAELHQLEHLHTRQGSQFDQFDMLLESHRQLNDVTNSMHTADAQELLLLVAQSWSQSWADLRAPLMNCLKTMFERPVHSILLLDRLNEEANLLLYRFYEMLNHLEAALELPPDPRDAELILERAIDFLHDDSWTNYGPWRGLLVDFCRREAIWPEQVAESIESLPRFQLTKDAHLADAIRADLPVRCICQATRLFWAV